MTGLLSQPIDAGPGARLVGYDEFGRPVYQGILGTSVYGEGLAAQPSRPNQDGWDMVAAAQSGGYWQPDTREDWGTPGQALNQVIGLLAEGALNGITAPGRAAQGQPVTMGDVWDTALDWGVLSAPMTAPPGALRAGALATDAAETPAEVIARMLREGRADEITDDMMAALTPNDNMELARLYESGATGMDMPLDEPSRMARAAEMGFDTGTPLYHGGARDFPAFDRANRGSATNAMSARRATWMVDDPGVAGGYATFAEGGPVQDLINRSYMAEADGDFDLAEDLMRQAEELEMSGASAQGGNIQELFARGNRQAFDADGGRYDANEYVMMDWVNEAQRGGYDGLQVENFVDNPDYSDWTEAMHVGIFDPRNIRSRFARFDPRLRHLAHLSAGIGGLAFLPGLLSEREANGA